MNDRFDGANLANLPVTQQDRFDGANLPQLLDLMHDIVVPDAPGWWPETPAWSLLAAWLIVMTGLGLWHWRAHRRRNRYRRDAEAELDAIMASGDDTRRAPQIAVLLKRTALTVFPRERVASMTGAAWAEFLTRTANDDRRVAELAPLIAAAPYRDDIESAAIESAARTWIRSHRV